MKNIVKLFGIIALVAVIGFSMVSCGGDDEGGETFPAPKGKLTVTNIPSEYNGKFAYVQQAEIMKENDSFNSIYVYGAAKLTGDAYGVYYTPVKISGGRVEIPMYIRDTDFISYKFIAYDGNGVLMSSATRLLTVRIVDTGSEQLGNAASLTRQIFSSGTFNNGNLTVQWQQE